MTPWGVTDQQLDVAFAAGRVRVGAANHGRGRCVRCKSLVLAGAGQKVYYDGHYVGVWCGPDCTGRPRPDPPKGAAA